MGNIAVLQTAADREVKAIVEAAGIGWRYVDLYIDCHLERGDTPAAIALCWGVPQWTVERLIHRRGPNAISKVHINHVDAGVKVLPDARPLNDLSRDVSDLSHAGPLSFGSGKHEGRRCVKRAGMTPGKCR